MKLRLGRDPHLAHFADRAEAGRWLAQALARYRTRRPLALALPRGGVAVALPIAEDLDAELDVLIVQKLRVEWQPELAMGAIAEGDILFWDERILNELRVPEPLRDQELLRARAELARRSAIYRSIRPRIAIGGRVVIIVDDGVATGSTLRAAIRAVATQGYSQMGRSQMGESPTAPAQIVVALPGGALETLQAIAEDPAVTEVVALAAPPDFFSVSQLYDSFPEVSTEEVCEILRGS